MTGYNHNEKTEKWLSYLYGLIRYPVFKRIDSVWNHDGMTEKYRPPLYDPPNDKQ